MAYHRFHGVNTCIVRIFNTYGPRMHVDDGRALPNFITQALRGEKLTIYGDGQQTRSFCYVDDLIDGIYRLLVSDVHEPVNMGNPDEMTIEQFAREIDSLVGKKAGLVFERDRMLPGDPLRRQPDITRAREWLGWQPKIGLKDGLQKTIPYFKEQLGI
jgi:dTDP-glucose 4,6-dehydratase